MWKKKKYQLHEQIKQQSSKNYTGRGTDSWNPNNAFKEKIVHLFSYITVSLIPVWN